MRSSHFFMVTFVSVGVVFSFDWVVCAGNKLLKRNKAELLRIFMKTPIDKTNNPPKEISGPFL